MSYLNHIDAERYYGDLTDGINDLKENLEADILHFSAETRRAGANMPVLPNELKTAMLYLIGELDRIYPLAVIIDSYMMDNARLRDIVNCLRDTIAEEQQPTTSNNKTIN